MVLEWVLILNMYNAAASVPMASKIACWTAKEKHISEYGKKTAICINSTTGEYY